MLSLEELRNPCEEALACFDLAEVDLACAVGLPGSERLDIPACLAWIDEAADWGRRYTQGSFERFVQDPAEYDHSEGVFRCVALMRVLKTGLGVRYNHERVAVPEDFTDSRDDFIHGIIEGRGGTCASLPVLFVAVGRRLGYPLMLVTTARHLFCRWDDPAGERFNVELSNGNGMDSHPDDYYRHWPVRWEAIPLEHTAKFLHSLSPREEVAHAWSKRGHLLHSVGRLGEAVSSFATATSLVTGDRLLDFVLGSVLNQRSVALRRLLPAELPRLEIAYPPLRRWPGLPEEMERRIIALDAWELTLQRPLSEGCRVVRCAVA